MKASSLYPWLLLLALMVAGTQLGASGPFSADGRYFVFVSLEPGLVPEDPNSQRDVFRYDRQTGAFVLVSVNQDHTASGDAGSHSPVISADGSVVAFESDASNLVSSDLNGTRDVFVRDLTTGVTTLISVNQSGADSGNGFSFRPQLSADGRIVTFESSATNLVSLPDANGGSRDVFARNRVTGVTTLVSANQGGTASGNGGSFTPQLSADGRVVVFFSFADDLVSNDSTSQRDVFARDLTTGVTTLVSVNQAGTGSGNGFSGPPEISADGTIVAFASEASDLVPNDNNRATDIFVRDLITGVTRLASVNLSATGSGNRGSGGGEDQGYQNLTLSADGRRVAFTSQASDLVANDSNGVNGDVFVRDLATSSTLLVSRNLAGTGSANSTSLEATLSADGTGVTFWSFASDLTAHPVDGRANLFLADLTTGEMHLATVNQSGGGSGNVDDDGEYYGPAAALSADGAVVAFLSIWNTHDSVLVAKNVDGPGHLFDGIGDLFLFSVDQSGAFLESGGLVVIEAEHFHGRTTASGHTWEASTDRAGFVGESAMRAGPNSGVAFKTLSQVAARSPSLTYRVQFTTAGDYNFWVRGWAANGSDDSVNIGVDGANIHSLPYPETRAWVWRSLRVTVPSPGLHEINLWMREDGAYVDRLLLAANLRFIPTGDGPPESGRGSAAP